MWKLCVCFCRVEYSFQGWIQEFEIGGGGGGGAKSYTPSQRGVQGCVYIEFRWKGGGGGGGAHPLHPPPGSSHAFFRICYILSSKVIAWHGRRGKKHVTQWFVC